jgi:eukaryotic-like serine/threonine-protein kinase
LRIKEALLGRDHVAVAASLENLANVRKDQGRYDEALAFLDRALAIRIAVQGADHVEVGGVHQDLADVLAVAGKLDRALTEYRAALEIKTKKLGHDHPKVIELVLNRAEAEMNGARYAAALADYTSAAATIEGNVALARYAPFALTGIGDCELGLHEPTKALPPLERALALRLAHPDDPLELARTRFAIARAVGNNSRAVELARAAHDAYAAAGKPGEVREHEVAQWLARPK